MSGALTELRATGRLGDEGVALLYRTVRAVVRRDRLPPPEGYTSWDDEAVQEATHEFVAEHLLGKGRINTLLLRATDERSFEQLLAAYIRNFFRDRLRRSARGALLRRLGAILDGEPRFLLWVSGGTRHGSDSLWGLADWTNPEPFIGLAAALAPAAWRIPGITTIRWRPEAARRSPVADTRSLIRFMEGVLDAADGLLSVPQLVEIAAYRFALHEVPAFVSVDEPSSVSVPEPVEHRPDEVIAARTKAEDVYEQLSERERLILLRLGDDYRVIGEELGIPKSTVFDVAQRVRALVRVSLDPTDDPASVLRELEALAAGEV